MFYVYVIQNSKGDVYKGHSDNIQKRISEHNRGDTKSTRKANDWELKYSEVFEKREEAIKREKYLKSAAGRRFLKNKMVL